MQNAVAYQLKSKVYSNLNIFALDKEKKKNLA